jgi:hypothetical protein
VTNLIAPKKCIVGNDPTTHIRLQEVPAKFLDAKKWGFVQSKAPSEIAALCYLNAPFPNQAHPFDMLRAPGRSRRQVVGLYNRARDLAARCLLLLRDGKLRATGIGRDGKRLKIPANGWSDLYPLFATNRANGSRIRADGSRIEFKDIHIHVTNAYNLEEECVTWLVGCPDIRTSKKRTIYDQAKLELRKKLPPAVFDAAYKRVLRRKRGRPANVK